MLSHTHGKPATKKNDKQCPQTVRVVGEEKKKSAGRSAHPPLIHAGKVPAKTLKDKHGPRGIPSKLPELTASLALGCVHSSLKERNGAQIPHPSWIAASKPLALEHVFREPRLHLNVGGTEGGTARDGWKSAINWPPRLQAFSSVHPAPLRLPLAYYACLGKRIA